MQYDTTIPPLVMYIYYIRCQNSGGGEWGGGSNVSVAVDHMIPCVRGRPNTLDARLLHLWGFCVCMLAHQPGSKTHREGKNKTGQYLYSSKAFFFTVYV